MDLQGAQKCGRTASGLAGIAAGDMAAGEAPAVRGSPLALFDNSLVSPGSPGIARTPPAVRTGAAVPRSKAVVQVAAVLVAAALVAAWAVGELQGHLGKWHSLDTPGRQAE